VGIMKSAEMPPATITPEPEIKNHALLREVNSVTGPGNCFMMNLILRPYRLQPTLIHSRFEQLKDDPFFILAMRRQLAARQSLYRPVYGR
jgi:hypothetical protein